MIDPLAEVVLLLQPAMRFSKLVDGAGRWRVHRPHLGEPFYCVVLEGQCRIAVDGHPSITLQAGDFVLVPATHSLVNESLEPPEGNETEQPVQIGEGHFRVGNQDGPADLRLRIGHCSFGSPDAGLLVQLLPQLIHIRGEQRLATLVQMLGEETRAKRLARELVLERLLEVLLIEALRCGDSTTAPPGLARGLADERLACALRAFHARPEHPWTITELAREAALSRSAFFARFSRIVGVAPMEYVLAWRMAIAKRLLRENELEITQIAERVGYSSASTFSVAFMRQVGTSPARYGRGNQAA